MYMRMCMYSCFCFCFRTFQTSEFFLSAMGRRHVRALLPLTLCIAAPWVFCSSSPIKAPRTLCRASQVEEIVGPGARELLAEFRRSYRENPYPEKLSLFFPDIQEILRILYSSEDFKSTKFLNTVDGVFRQLHHWPSAWSGLERLLDPQHPWTEPYCSTIIAGGGTKTVLFRMP